MLRDINVAVVSGREETDREDVLDVLRCRQSVIDGLTSSGFSACPVDITREDFLVKGRITRKIREKKPSCVFNLFEGFADASYLEIKFAGILESMGIPFTGNPSRTLALCLDKELARRTLAARGLPVAPGRCVFPGYPQNICDDLRFPLFVKPRMEDSSVGIDERSMVRSKDGLYRLLDERLALFPDGLIVEEYIDGREFNAGFMGSYPYDLMAVSSIRFEHIRENRAFLGYDSKWDPESDEYRNSESVPEEGIDPRMRREICRISREAGRVMGCRGYFRVDLRESGGKLFILEVNPNPDINIDSGFVRQSARRGFTYPGMVARLVEASMNWRVYDEERGLPKGQIRNGSGDKDKCLLGT